MLDSIKKDTSSNYWIIANTYATSLFQELRSDVPKVYRHPRQRLGNTSYGRDAKDTKEESKNVIELRHLNMEDMMQAKNQVAAKSFVVADSQLGCLVGSCFDGAQARNISQVGLCSPANVVDNVNPTLHVHGFSRTDDAEVSDANFVLAGGPVPNVGNSSGVHVSSESCVRARVNLDYGSRIYVQDNNSDEGSKFLRHKDSCVSGHHSLNNIYWNDDPGFLVNSSNMHTNGFRFCENAQHVPILYLFTAKMDIQIHEDGTRTRCILDEVDFDEDEGLLFIVSDNSGEKYSEMKIHQFVKYGGTSNLLGKFIANENSRIQSQEDIDNHISAELPSEEVDPEGHRVVAEFMIHGPCGEVCPMAACMKNDPKCTKHFPKEYCHNTYTDADGFVLTEEGTQE
ncbi:hypothetical protein Tco_1177853 [Tanacetum coccineum]